MLCPTRSRTLRRGQGRSRIGLVETSDLRFYGQKPLQRVMLDSTSILSLVGLSLTVIALAIAAWQSFEAKRQATLLQSISSALSTRFLGTFPEYLPQVASLLSRATRRIDICVGTPTHGVLSARASWLDCQHELEKKGQNKVPISIACPDKVHRDQITVAQFRARRGTWDQWKSEGEHAENIREFLKYNAPHLVASEISFEQFLGELADLEDRVVAERFRGMQVVECPALITTYFWAIDEREAIFAFLSLSASTVAHGFYTNDIKLIAALLEMKEQYERFASDVHIDEDHFGRKVRSGN